MIQQLYPWACIPDRPIIQKDTCNHVFIATLFTIAKIWKQPECPLTAEWMKKMWYRYTAEHYSALENNEVISCATMQMDLEMLILSEVRERQTLYDITSMRNLKHGTDGPICETNRSRGIENRRVVAKGGQWERVRLGAWCQQTQTGTHRVDKQQGPALYHRELYSIPCDKPQWKECEKQCICIPESRN